MLNIVKTFSVSIADSNADTFLMLLLAGKCPFSRTLAGRSVVLVSFESWRALAALGSRSAAEDPGGNGSPLPVARVTAWDRPGHHTSSEGELLRTMGDDDIGLTTAS